MIIVMRGKGGGAGPVKGVEHGPDQEKEQEGLEMRDQEAEKEGEAETETEEEAGAEIMKRVNQ